MNNYKAIIDYITSLTYQEFQSINKQHQLEIEDDQLRIIFDIIKNNIFALINSDYHNILFNYIQKKTSLVTCLKVKKLILEHQFYFNPLLNT